MKSGSLETEAVYILSAGRSGSTLLNMLLGSHPEALAVGELTHLPKNLALNTECSCGEAVRNCGVWRPVAERMGAIADPYHMDLGFISASRVIDHKKLTRAYRIQWKLHRALMYVAWHSRLPVKSPRFLSTIETTLALYDTLREVTGARVIVDASKDYLKGIGIYKASNAKVILLTRDGRASFYSRLKSGFSRQRSLAAWRNYYENALPLIEKHISDGRMVQLRYEDLAADPARELARLCSFIGIEYHASMLDFRNVVHHVVNGNRMRTGSVSRIQPDLAWRAELSARDRAYFDQHAGALNASFGYT